MRCPPEERDAEVDGRREGAEPEGEDPPRRYPAPWRGGRRGGAERREAKEDESQSPEHVGPADEPVGVPGPDPEVPPVGEREHEEPRREERGEGEPPVPVHVTTSPRKKYQIRTPVESMMLKESRKVTSVILLVVQFTRNTMAQRSSR